MHNNYDVPQVRCNNNIAINEVNFLRFVVIGGFCAITAIQLCTEIVNKIIK